MAAPEVRRDPAETRRAMRFIAITRAAATFMAIDRARELASNLAGCDDDLITVESVHGSIDRRVRLFGLVVRDAPAAAAAIVAAWRSVGPPSVRP